MQRTLQRKNPQTKMVASVRSMKGNKEPKNSHTVSRGPQPLGLGPVLVCGLLETGPHSRRRAVGKRVKLHLYTQLLLSASSITASAQPQLIGH